MATKHTYHKHDLLSSEMSIDILKRLKYPTEVVNNVGEIIVQHMRGHDLEKMKRVCKIKTFLGHPLIEKIALLIKADEAGSKTEIVYRPFKEIYEEAVKKYGHTLPPPLVTGDDLIERGLKPGPEYKKILSDVYNLQLDGKNNKETLIAHAMGLHADWTQRQQTIIEKKKNEHGEWQRQKYVIPSVLQKILGQKPVLKTHWTNQTVESFDASNSGDCVMRGPPPKR